MSGELERTPQRRSAGADCSELICGERAEVGARTPQPGDEVGPYTIVRCIGEGTFGVVYLASQSVPIHRQVAIKILKPGMDTHQIVQRFEAEREALALMDHPCVATVLDAGTTADGYPYFVMEYVPGVPITEHCDRHRLGIDERLRLFMHVCDAVQHAHQKGIVHRDLKPSNILVTLVSGEAVPRVIDFGVAKALHRRLTTETLFTEQGQIIGTPEYMSPEQAMVATRDIDTRSDVYSLGALLYELLTGERPFSSKVLRRTGLAEIQRIIREEDPPKPSTRLSSMEEESAEHAAHRHADPKTLMRALRGDLDWIIMKALEKSRVRRYRTASALANDIRRHLGNEPVRAGPPQPGYRLRKFMQRHRMGVAATLFISGAIILGAAGATWGVITAGDARNAEAAARDAQDQAQRRIVHGTLAAIDEQFGDQPLVQARLLQTLAHTLRELHLPEHATLPQETALAIHRRELGDDHPDTLACLQELVSLLSSLGRLAEAEQLQGGSSRP